MVLVSAALHVVAGCGLYAACALGNHMVPKPQVVMTARLVRLGPARSKDLLPTLAAAAKPRPAPKPKQPVATPPPPSSSNAQAAKAIAQADAAPVKAGQAALQRTQSALQRLRQINAGELDGDEAGDTDTAAEGDRYDAMVKKCIQDNYVIRGLEKARTSDKEVTMLIRIGASGKITDYHLLKSSGLPGFDADVARAVRGCGSVPPPPMARRDEVRREGLALVFKP